MVIWYQLSATESLLNYKEVLTYPIKLNTLWCITLLYVNQEKKKKKNTAMHSSLFCLFSSFKPDQQGSHSLKHAHRNVQSQVSHLFLLHP